MLVIRTLLSVWHLLNKTLLHYCLLRQLVLLIWHYLEILYTSAHRLLYYDNIAYILNVRSCHVSQNKDKRTRLLQN